MRFNRLAAMLPTVLFCFTIFVAGTYGQDESDPDPPAKDTAAEVAGGDEVTSSDDDIWTTDAAAAVELASNERRDLFLLFTGSDWCPPCIKLENQILSKKVFIESANKQMVLVKFDFPQSIELSEELQNQNDQWSNRFGIEGFPTVVLLDSELKPYAFTGFRDESAAAYLEHINELTEIRKQRDQAMDDAVNKIGVERAEALDLALSKIDPDIVAIYYEDVVNEIGELDRGDEAGLRTKYFAARDRELRKAVMSNIAMVARLREPDQAIAFIDKSLEETKLPLKMWLQAQFTKLRLLRQLANVEQANALIDEMIAVDELEANTRQRLMINKVYYWVSLGNTDDATKELERFISSTPDKLLLMIAKGELLDSQAQFKQAIQAYDQCLVAAAAEPQVLLEVVGAKADALFELKQFAESTRTLDRLADDVAIPVELRAEALLHKALILRETNRRRAAILAENRAIELVDTPQAKGQIQKLVDQLRRKFVKVKEADESGQ